MSYFARAETPAKSPEDLSPTPPELALFSRLEGLIGEEAALLAIRPEDRGARLERRLSSISAGLDRVAERLLERAERLAGEHPASEAAG